MNRKLKILSSDDDEGIRSFLFSLLEEHGHHVEFARCGDEVFKHLGRARYDLLILDVNTPGTNGYKVAEKISNNINNRPKILIFTARDLENEKPQCAACGADAVIRKGTPCEKILETIAGLFPDVEPAGIPSDTGDGATQGGPGSAHDTPPEPGDAGPYGKLYEDLQVCISRVARVEDNVNLKNMRYEEFIRDLLKEKQRTEKNYLEFKRMEAEFLRLKNWGCAVAAAAALAVLRSFF